MTPTERTRLLARVRNLRSSLLSLVEDLKDERLANKGRIRSLLNAAGTLKSIENSLGREIPPTPGPAEWDWDDVTDAEIIHQEDE